MADRSSLAADQQAFRKMASEWRAMEEAALVAEASETPPDGLILGDLDAQ